MAGVLRAVEAPPPSRPMRNEEIHPGDVIAGKYRVRTILGRTHGLVVEGFHTEFDQRVVIKILLAGHGEPREIERFRREARTLSKLESEHVARIIDVGTEPDGSFYLVRQFLEGTDLATSIREGGPLPLVDAVTITLQLAEALAETHANNIIIRELGPEHVMLTQRSGGAVVAKITDFGTAKLMKDSVAPGPGGELTATAMFGLSPYSSPELVRKAKNVDVRTDVWSLGAILYELLTGYPPFQGDTARLMLAITKENPTPPTQIRGDLPPEIDDIVGWALAKDVDTRFKSVHALAHALTPFASNEGRVLIERIAQMSDAAKRRRSPSAPPPPPSFRSTPAPDSRAFVDVSPISAPMPVSIGARDVMREDSVTALKMPSAPPSFRSLPPPSVRPPLSVHPVAVPASIPPPPALPSAVGQALPPSERPASMALPTDRNAFDRKVMIGALALVALLLPVIVALVFVRRDHAVADAPLPTTVFVAATPAPTQVAAPIQTGAAAAPSAPAPIATIVSATPAPIPAAEPVAEEKSEKAEKAEKASGAVGRAPVRATPHARPAPAKETKEKEPPPEKEAPAASNDSQGTLLAVAVGGDCAFSVNGASKGTSSSLRIQLKPGTYSVSCRPSSGAPKSKSVTVKPGETAMAAFKLGS